MPVAGPVPCPTVPDRPAGPNILATDPRIGCRRLVRLPPRLRDHAAATWGYLRESALAAWVLYALVGMCGAGALVLVACDGDSHPRDDVPKPAKKVAGKKVAPPAPPVDAAAPLPPYQMYPDLGAAIQAIAATKPRVIGLGELHVRTDRPAPAMSALARFSAEVVPALGDKVSDVVVETWTVDPSCQKGAAGTKKIESNMKRPAETKSEIGSLFGVAKERAITAHVMRLTCADLSSFAGDDKLDAEKLLTLVTRELDRVTRSAVRYRDEHNEARPLILVYGGALHNDLYPFESTKEWSYAPAVDAATAGHFVEVDVYAPELVEGDAIYEREAWYPLVAKSDHRGVMLVERAPRSYLAILPRS